LRRSYSIFNDFFMIQWIVELNYLRMKEEVIKCEF
jgi:hypothetical protein